MLGMAIRIGQRMGIHSEADCAKYGALEAEMRRRLWWSLKLFDARMGELADFKTAMIAPIWDCNIPLNLNDSDLRPEMKDTPSVHDTPSDAIFIVVRSMLGGFVRDAQFHLDSSSPDNLKDLPAERRKLSALEKKIEDKYLKLCNPDIPLHFMTMWTLRTHLARYRLIDHYWKYSDTPEGQTDAQRDIGVGCAVKMLTCDTKVMGSPTTKGFIWMARFYFPFPAYIHILEDLKRRPTSKHADEAWEAMSDNYQVRFDPGRARVSPMFDIFCKFVIQAWEAREAISISSGQPAIPPNLLSIVKEQIAKQVSPDQGEAIQQPTPHDTPMTVDSLPIPVPMPMGFGIHNFLDNTVSQDDLVGTGSPFSGQNLLNIDVNQLPWTTMDWSFGGQRPWWNA
jgi:hypothetical protein